MRRGFDLVAPHYRWMEILTAGGKLHRCRTQYLKEVDSSSRVLVFGEGNGRFLCDFLRTNSVATVSCVDSSSGMIDHARRHMRHFGLSEDRVSFIHENALNWKPRLSDYDLIVTQFFLDCFPANELRSVVGEIALSSTTDAKWLVADFREPVSGWRRARARFMLRVMYWFFRNATGLAARELTNPDLLLCSAGFLLKTRRISEWGLLHSDLWVKQ